MFLIGEEYPADPWVSGRCRESAGGSAGPDQGAQR